MVYRGSTRRDRFRGRAKDPVLQHVEHNAQRLRDERQANLAREKVVEHPQYERRSTGALLAEIIFQEFVTAKKDGSKSKTQVAIENARRRFAREHPRYGGDHAGKRLGQQIAKDCLRAAGDMLYGSGSYTPSAKHTDH